MWSVDMDSGIWRVAVVNRNQADGLDSRAEGSSEGCPWIWRSQGLPEKVTFELRCGQGDSPLPARGSFVAPDGNNWELEERNEAGVENQHGECVQASLIEFLVG